MVPPTSARQRELPDSGDGTSVAHGGKESWTPSLQDAGLDKDATKGRADRQDSHRTLMNQSLLGSFSLSSCPGDRHRW
jgi:hypothetical protein